VFFVDKCKEYKLWEECRDFKLCEDCRDFKPCDERDYKKDDRCYAYVLVLEDELEGSFLLRSSDSGHSGDNKVEDSSTKVVNFVIDDWDCLWC